MADINRKPTMAAVNKCVNAFGGNETKFWRRIFWLLTANTMLLLWLWLITGGFCKRTKRTREMILPVKRRDSGWYKRLAWRRRDVFNLLARVMRRTADVAVADDSFW